MDNPVTFSDITLLNTLATCANYHEPQMANKVFKDFIKYENSDSE